MKTWFDEGLHVILGNSHLLFDPSNWFEAHENPPATENPVDLVLISHGHSDHSNLISKYNMILKLKGKKKTPVNVPIPIIMHPATREMLALWNRIDRPVLLKENESITFNDIKITAHNAGHCIGSLQFEIMYKDKTFVFTGDINTKGGMAMNPGKIIKCDYVAIEATAGEKQFISLEKNDAYATIYNFIKSSLEINDNVVLYGHALGKIQELTKLIGFFNNINARVLVENRGFYLNNIYEKYVDRIPVKYIELKKEILENGHKNIIISNFYQLKSTGKSIGDRFNIPDPPSMVISAHPKNEKNFPSINLSSHDDFVGLKNYVENAISMESGKIIVYHGSHENFTKHLRELGYDVFDSHKDVLADNL